MTQPCLPPERSPASPGFALPSGATDCHMHLFGRAPAYPYVAERDYTPAEDNLGAVRSLYRTLGVDRFVAVQPSVYGADNRAQLDLARAVGLEFRIVAVLPPDLPDAEMMRLHEEGVRGIRFILAHPGGLDLARLEHTADRAQAFGWHLEFLLKPAQLLELAPRLAGLSCPVSVDHMAFLPAEQGTTQPGFQALLRLLRHEHAWVKFSGAYRLSSAPDDYTALRPLADAIVGTCPDRIVWGSDWPHVGQMTAMPRTTPLLDALADWVPDPAQRHRILVDNPCRLYGFTLSQTRNTTRNGDMA